MKDSVKIALGIFLGIVALCACATCLFFALSATGVTLLAAAPTSTLPQPVGPIPARTPATSLTQSPPQQLGRSVVHNDLKITLNAHEVSGSYVDSYDMQESPVEGAKFLWISVTVENVGKNAVYAPFASDFHVINEGEQTDSDFYFASRPGYEQYEGGEIFPGVSKSGWIRFTIPGAAQPNELIVVFKPLDLFSDTYYTWILAP